MKKFVFYRTKSYGGTEGDLLEVRDFETTALAKKDALKDLWNRNFSLYRVTLNFHEVVQEEEKLIAKRIPCHYDCFVKKKAEILKKRKLILYRTKFFSLNDHSQVFQRTFETEELARANALTDPGHDDFSLYKVVFTFNGLVQEEENYLSKVPCYHDIKLRECISSSLSSKKRGPTFYKLICYNDFDRQNIDVKLFSTKNFAYGYASRNENYCDFILNEICLILSGKISFAETECDIMHYPKKRINANRSLKHD